MKYDLSKLIMCTGILVLLFSACKKDALEVDSEKRYLQTNAAPASDPLLETTISLILKPNGRAAINPGGDIVWVASYKIRGKKITVEVEDLDRKYDFTIISDTELHGRNGEILKLEE